MADEARSILDSLMGGDRNALLPPGTAVPRPKKRNNASSSSATSSLHNHQPLTLPTKRSKSCYDADVDPLYCAWGVNVYELFVNTKSDLGVLNPFVPDDGARSEYLSLPKHEQERLGFEHALFVKLQDLVRQCDRAVSRNKEKLEQEIQRNAAKNNNATTAVGGGRISDFYVNDIDEGAIVQLAQCQLRLDAVEKEVLQILETMDGHVVNQRQLESKINEVKVKLIDMEDKLQFDKGVPLPDVEDAADGVPLPDTGDGAPGEDVVKSEVDVVMKSEDDVVVKAESTADSSIKAEPASDIVKVESGAHTEETNAEPTNGVNPTDLELLRLEMEQLTKELDDVILMKQRSQFDLARKIQQYAPLQDSAEQQRKHLHFVKSDITMDKTVCEVSGNFMSARDADERIAAHYAGKQYVGWKLVRDKFKEMQQQYGRYGPPRPQRRDDAGGRHGGPVPAGVPRPDDRYAAGRGGGYNSNRGPPVPVRGGGGGHGGGPRDYDRGGGRDRDRGGYSGGSGGYGRGGGGGYDRDRRDGGRWGR